MSTQASLAFDSLLPTARILLIGGFGCALVVLMREGEETTPAFERLVVGFLALLFHQTALEWVNSAAVLLDEKIRALGNSESLKTMILDAFLNAVTPPPGAKIPQLHPIAGAIEFVWRTGVWGVMTQIADWCFVLAGFLIEQAREVIWKMILFLAPLACGVYPIFPRILKNIALYSVEVALWAPVLALVNLITSHVAVRDIGKVGSLGLPIIAIELIAIILMLAVPAITHRLVSGAMTTDLGATSTLLAMSKKLIRAGGRLLG